MKLMIAIPTIDYMHFAFVRCLSALIEHLKDRGTDYELAFRGNTMVYMARDDLARKAIADGFTHVLWLDADMIFPETIVEDLQRSGKPFVSGVYSARRPPHRSCVFTSLFPVERPAPDAYPDDVFEIHGCGFGCVLMETEILKKTGFYTGLLFLPDGAFGEDLSFCQRARSQGFRLWCDPRVVCGHIGQMAVYPEAQFYQECEGTGYRGIYG